MTKGFVQNVHDRMFMSANEFKCSSLIGNYQIIMILKYISSKYNCNYCTYKSVHIYLLTGHYRRVDKKFI